MRAHPRDAITGDHDRVSALALAPGPGGKGLTGWAIGDFTTQAVGHTALLRLTAQGWQPYDDRGAVADTFDQFAQQSTGNSADTAIFHGQPLKTSPTTLATSFVDSRAASEPCSGYRRLAESSPSTPSTSAGSSLNGVTPTINSYGY